MSRVSWHRARPCYLGRAGGGDASTRTAERPMMPREGTRANVEDECVERCVRGTGRVGRGHVDVVLAGRAAGRRRRFKSVGRGAPVAPAIPAETWVDPDNIEPFPPAEIEGYPEQYWLVGPFEEAARAARRRSSAPPATARCRRGSSRSRWTSSPRRTSTRTAHSGPTSAISAATARMGSRRSGVTA